MLIGLPDMYGMRTVRNLCRACFVRVEGMVFGGRLAAEIREERAQPPAGTPGSTDPHVMFVRPGTVWDPKRGMWVKAEGEGE